ncbi:PLP-dependent transferase [Lactarius sanguifluus]|nr:PLP-dependent transferase [Lactarius sanguifluus]
MALLFRNLRVHQIFGANTDVGKTILTSGLVRTSAAKKIRVFYLKPVSTGPLQDADDEHVKRYAGLHGDLVNAHCLYRFDEPVSPHLAANMAADRRDAGNVGVPTDEAFTTSIASYIRKCASDPHGVGHTCVHSPTLSGTTQLDSYRPLFLPTVLVGDSRLGGISSTISAYESLLLRGYRNEYYRNWEYLASYFAEHGVRVTADFIATEDYYRKIASDDGGADGLAGVIEYLDSRHDGRIKELETMPRRTLDTVWWPFVQHGLVKQEGDVNVIDSAWGDHFTVFTGHRPPPPSAVGPSSLLESQFDSSASWWTQALGHAHPCTRSCRLPERLAAMDTVMYPQATHAPALRLAERLVNDGPGKGWASRAFISDNWLHGHGDRTQDGDSRAVTTETRIGAMDACEEGVYTCEWHDAKGYWFEPPSLGIKNGRAFVDVPSAVAHTKKKIEGEPLSNSQNGGAPPFGALVLEPLVLGAGGMVFVDPLFQRLLIDAARAAWPPRLWRLGLHSAGPLLGAHPDVSDDVFRAFEGSTKTEALLHGHSYTAYATLDRTGPTWRAETLGTLLARLGRQAGGEEANDGTKGNRAAVWSLWSPQFVDMLSRLEIIDRVMTLGHRYQSHSAQALLKTLGGGPFSIHFRTLGDVAYFMTSLNTPSTTIRAVEDRIWAVLGR